MRRKHDLNFRINTYTYPPGFNITEISLLYYKIILEHFQLICNINWNLKSRQLESANSYKFTLFHTIADDTLSLQSKFNKWNETYSKISCNNKRKVFAQYPHYSKRQMLFTSNCQWKFTPLVKINILNQSSMKLPQDINHVGQILSKKAIKLVTPNNMSTSRTQKTHYSGVADFTELWSGNEWPD